MEGKQFNISPLELYKIMTEQLSADKRLSEQLAQEIVLELENDEARRIEIKKEIAGYMRQNAKRKLYINFKALFVLFILAIVLLI